MGEGMKGEINRDIQTEATLRFLDKAKKIEALHEKEIVDIFKDEASTRDFLSSIGDDDFITLLAGLNGVLRGKDKEDWVLDGENVMLSGFAGTDYPPRAADKPELLKELSAAIRAMAAEQQRDLEDVAVLVSVGINAIHAFMDGNGRTSRLAYTLIKDGYNAATKDKLPELLGEFGADQLDANPGRINMYLMSLLADESMHLDGAPFNYAIYYEGTSKDLEFAAGISEDDKRFLRELIRSDQYFMKLLFAGYLRAKPDTAKYIDEYPGQQSILLDRLLPDLSKEVIGDLITEYWQLKKRRVEILIDAIQNPNQDKYIVKDGDKEISLLDYFKTTISAK